MGNCSSSSNDGIISGGMNRNERKFIKECLELNSEFMTKQNAKKRLNEFIDKLSVLILEKGDKLFSFGEKSDKLYIVAHGAISIISEDGIDYGTQGRGALVGTFGFFNNKTRSAHAKALKQTKLFYMVRHKLIILFIITYHILQYLL
jgi:CRP-like cAMP-binding protein